MDFLKKYWHVITIPFTFFTVWLWSFPMYGPLLAHIGNTSKLFMLFLLSHAVGLLLYGYIVDFINRAKKVDYKIELKSILIISLVLSILTIIFPFLPAYLFIPLIIIIGLLSGPMVVFYLYYLSVTIVDGTRARVLGFIFFLAGLIFMFFLLLPYTSWMFIINGVFLLCPFLFIKSPLAEQQNQSKLDLADTNKVYWLSLFLLVLMFYLGSGLMYNLLYANIMSVDGGFFDIGFLFYPIVVLPAGFLADKKGRKTLINVGLCLAGIGFLLLLLFDSLNSISMILLQGSFAVMDLFVFLTIIDWTDFFSNRKFISIGLFLNVIIIFISGLPFLGTSISSLIPIELWPAAGLLSILLIIPIVNFIKETFLIRQSEDVLKNEDINFDSFCDQYSISPREKEVIIFLLEGKDTGTITELLSISYNTLKTHLRNIYRKTDTGGQTELILFIWKNTK